MSPTPLSPDPPHSSYNLHHTMQLVHYFTQLLHYSVCFNLVLIFYNPTLSRLEKRPPRTVFKPWKNISCSEGLLLVSKRLFKTPICLIFLNQGEKYIAPLWSDFILSGLSLALNKEGCDWRDRHSARANSGRATHLSQTRYTPLVEVNQAIKAWSF